MQNNLLFVAKEGWRYIGYVTVAFIIFVLLHLNTLGYLAFGIILFLAYLYRNPERELLKNNELSSPVDGKVISIENLINEDYAYKINIESSYSDVAILRVPMNSKVVNIESIKGTKLAFNNKLFKLLNEHTTLTLKNDNNNIIKIKHTIKNSIDDIYTYIKKDDTLNISARYGFMLNGLTTIYLPKEFNIDVAVGTQLFASNSMLGSFSKDK